MSARSRIYMNVVQQLRHFLGVCGVVLALLVALPTSAGAVDVPFKLVNRTQTIEGVGQLENGHFIGQVQNGGLSFQITGDIRGNEFTITADGYFCPTGSLAATRSYGTGSTHPAAGKVSIALSVSCGGYWQNQEKVTVYFDLPQSIEASGSGAVAPAAGLGEQQATPAGSVNAPFRFEANTLVYEGVAKIENGRLTGDAAANGGSVHLEGDIKDGKLSVQATGNFAPGFGMGSNLLANGAISPAMGKVTFTMVTSAGRDYAASLKCRLSLDLSGAGAPASATVELSPTSSAPAPDSTSAPTAAPTPAPATTTTQTPVQTTAPAQAPKLVPATTAVPPAGSAEAELPPMDPIDEAYVAAVPAKIRAQPQLNAPRVKTIPAGQTINVMGKLKGQDWYLVSENDQPIGYVVADQLVPESQYRSASNGVSPAAIAPPQPAIPQALANLDFGRYVALVIGNDNYANGLPALKTAGDDAWAVAETLKNDYAFRVTVIVDATRAQIIGALARLRETLTWDDNLLIYYAGHGSYDQGADQGYWLPVDAAPNDPTNWVSNTDITNMLKAIQARHVMVVADSCYSGTLTRDANVGIRDVDYIQRMVQKKARTVMTSGGLEPVADTGGGSHSVFASAFIAALQQNTGIMDAQSFFAKVREPVVLAAPQTPEYSNLRFAGHEGGDFVFVRKQ